MTPRFLALSTRFGGSPLYQFLCEAIADDPAVIQLARYARPSEPTCFLFLGSLQYLGLLPEPPAAHETRLRYRRMYIESRVCWLDNANAIREQLNTRRVQTNESGRSRLFALGAIIGAAQLQIARLHHVDLGASAGLNLYWDRYDVRLDPPSSLLSTVPMPRLHGSLQLPLSCEVLGASALGEISERAVAVEVLERIGVDVAPVDIRVPDERAWLRSLIWSDQPERLNRFDAAVEKTALIPVRVINGDAVFTLTDICGGLPSADPVLITHSYLMDKLNWRQAASLNRRLRIIAQQRPVIEVGMEYEGDRSRWSVATWSCQALRRPCRTLVAAGACHPHGDAVSIDVSTRLAPVDLRKSSENRHPH